MGQRSSGMDSSTTPANSPFSVSLSPFDPLNLTSTGSAPESDAYYSAKVDISLGLYRDRLVSTRAEVLSLIKGQQAKIPDLTKSRGWGTPAKHPSVQELSDEIQAWLKTQCSTEDELNHLIGSDIAGFAAWMAPNTDLDKARWVCYYLGWLFIFDDKFENAAKQNNRQLTLTILHKAFTYISKTMTGSDDDAAALVQDDPLLREWNKRVSIPLRATCDAELRSLLAGEIKSYLQGLGDEANAASHEGLPTLDEYWAYRMGSISVRFLIVGTAFTHNIRLPSSLLSSPLMKTLWNAAVEYMWIVNDIFSAHKEVQAGDINLLTLLVAHTGNLQTALDMAVAAAGAAARQFDHTAVLLREMVKEDKDVLKELDRYVRACQAVCSGNVEWSMRTPRYGLEKFKVGEREFVVGM